MWALLSQNLQNSTQPNPYISSTEYSLVMGRTMYEVLEKNFERITFLRKIIE